MASYQKRSGKWRVQVRRKGVTKSATFYTKAEAREWATEIEREIDTGKLAARSRATLADAFRRYANTTSPTKKGRRWEQVRLAMLERDRLADVRFIDLSPADIAQWRDRRLQDVSAATVRREMVLISSVVEVARREWQWIDVNPCRDVKKPPNPPHRERRISDDEIERVCFALGYSGGRPLNQSQEVAVMFLLAIETAMRLGEICGIRRRDWIGRAVRLPETKNGTVRLVPLSREAGRLLELLPKDRERLFSVQSETASTLFRRARKKAEIDDLTFHDSRHEACTRLARKIDALTLAKITGHRDPRSLAIYFNPTADEIADLLDAADAPTDPPRAETTAADGQCEPMPESRACK